MGEANEFYDLARDPLEIMNMQNTNEVSNEHSAILENILENYENFDDLEKIKLDKASLEDLKTLGYVE